MNTRQTVVARVQALFILTAAIGVCDWRLLGMPAAAQTELKVGSPAPPLKLDHWFRDGEGIVEKVTEFEPGKFYVLAWTYPGNEFTVSAILAELQETYGEQGLQTAIISSLTEEELKSRLTKGSKQKSKGGRTWLECLRITCTAFDPELSAYNDYVVASGGWKLPKAFIVGKTGQIEWIGYPVALLEPLELIFNDKFDRDAYALKQKAELERLPVYRDTLLARQQGDHEQVLAIIDKEIENHNTSKTDFYLNYLRLEALLASGNEDAATLLGDLAALHDTAKWINGIAETVVLAGENGKQPHPASVAAGIELAKRACQMEPANVKCLQTLAKLYHMNQQLENAISTQLSALRRVESMMSEIEPYYKQLLKEKEKKGQQDNPDKKEQPQEQTPREKKGRNPLVWNAGYNWDEK